MCMTWIILNRKHEESKMNRRCALFKYSSEARLCVAKNPIANPIKNSGHVRPVRLTMCVVVDFPTPKSINSVSVIVFNIFLV